jgi:NAD(P)-dependent dehydrogenase (short-subunit alcohol dehydrogenase family)
MRPTCVITGASSGIGAATATGVARAGYDLALVGRDQTRLAEVADRCRSEGAEVATYRADFAALEQVRRLAAELLTAHPRIDVLVNNAGTVLTQRTTTVDGYETTFAVNHLAPYLLTRLLLERLVDNAPSRVVTVASDAYRFGDVDPDDWMTEHDWKPMKAYGRSKLCNVLFTAELSRRVDGTGVAVNCLHPGFVSTSLGREHRIAQLGLRLIRPFIRGPEKGARTSVLLATGPLGADNGGQYFVDGEPRDVLPYARDEKTARRLWEDGAELVGLPH